MVYEEIFVTKQIEDKVVEILDKKLKEIDWEEKIRCLVDEVIEEYDFDDYFEEALMNWLSDSFKEEIEYKLEEVLGKILDNDLFDSMVNISLK